jgi:hypothetical protein
MATKGPLDWSPSGGPPGSIGRFIHKLEISSTYRPVDRNPNMEDDEWSRRASHYEVTLKRPGKRMAVFFSIGNPDDKPDAETVLDNLASDSSTVENNPDFEGWAQDLGYDTDSRKAERTFHTIKTQAARLKRFLGEEGYKKLLWETERL